MGGTCIWWVVLTSCNSTVHCRDVTTSMANEGVEDVRDFKWESQLRYYWEHHEAPPSGVKPQVRHHPCFHHQQPNI
jgi:hypothetical protein